MLRQHSMCEKGQSSHFVNGLSMRVAKLAICIVNHAVYGVLKDLGIIAFCRQPYTIVLKQHKI